MSGMKPLNKALSSLLAAALVVLSPGIAPYLCAAEVIAPRVQGPEGILPAGAGAAALQSGAVPTLELPSALSLTGSAIPTLEAPQPLPALPAAQGLAQSLQADAL